MRGTLDFFDMRRNESEMLVDETRKRESYYGDMLCYEYHQELFRGVINVRYRIANDCIKAQIFHLIKESSVFVFQQGCLDARPVRHIDKLAESVLFIETPTSKMAGEKDLIKLLK